MGEIIKKLYSEQDLSDATVLGAGVCRHFSGPVRGDARFPSRTFQVPGESVPAALRLGFEVESCTDTQHPRGGPATVDSTPGFQCKLTPQGVVFGIWGFKTTGIPHPLYDNCTYHVTIPDVASELRGLANDITDGAVASGQRPAPGKGAVGGTGLKYDGAKTPVGKLPWRALHAIAKAAAEGDEKGETTTDHSATEMYDAAMVGVAVFQADEGRLAGLIYAAQCVLQLMGVGSEQPAVWLPGGPLLEVMEVMEKGAIKYAWDSWKGVRPVSRYVDAAIRHLFAWSKGELLDPEFGTRHLAHAACCLLFALEILIVNRDAEPGTPAHPDYVVT